MTRKQFLSKLDEILDQPSGTTHSGQQLADIENWDSLALMSFIAMVDGEFGFRVPGAELAKCTSVQNLMDLMGDRLTD